MARRYTVHRNISPVGDDGYNAQAWRPKRARERREKADLSLPLGERRRTGQATQGTKASLDPGKYLALARKMQMLAQGMPPGERERAVSYRGKITASDAQIVRALRIVRLSPRVVGAMLDGTIAVSLAGDHISRFPMGLQEHLLDLFLKGRVAATKIVTLSRKPRRGDVSSLQVRAAKLGIPWMKQLGPEGVAIGAQKL